MTAAAGLRRLTHCCRPAAAPLQQQQLQHTSQGHMRNLDAINTPDYLCSNTTSGSHSTTAKPYQESGTEQLNDLEVKLYQNGTYVPQQYCPPRARRRYCRSTVVPSTHTARLLRYNVVQRSTSTAAVVMPEEDPAQPTHQPISHACCSDAGQMHVRFEAPCTPVPSQPHTIKHCHAGFRVSPTGCHM